MNMNRPIGKKAGAMLAMVAFATTWLPAPAPALPANPEWLKAQAFIEDIGLLYNELVDVLAKLRCAGASSTKVAQVETDLRLAKAAMSINKYDRALEILQRARTTVNGISPTGPQARSIARLRSGIRLFVILVAVVVLVGVMSHRAHADEFKNPRRMSTDTRDAVPGYFQVLQQSGCPQGE